MPKNKMGELFDKGNYEALSKLISEAANKSIEFQVEGLIYQSRMMSTMDRLEQAQEFADQAIEISGNNKFHELEIRSLIAKGFSCGIASHGILNSVFRKLEMLLGTSSLSIEEESLQKINGDIHYLRGWYYFNSARPTEGWEEFEKALSIQRSHGSKASLCLVLLYYGFSCIETSSRGVESLKYLEEALKLARKIGNPHYLGLALNWYAGGIGLHRNARESLKHFEEGIQVYKELGEAGERKLSRIYNNLSIIHKNLEEFDKSLEYLKLYISINERINDLVSLAFGHFNLSNTYSSMNKLDKAIFHTKKALDIAYQINHKSMITVYHSSLGGVYFAKGDINLAEKEFLLVQNLLKDNGEIEFVAWNEISLLNVHTLKMQTEKAFEKVETVKSLLHDSNSNHQLGWLYINEGINHRTLGKFDLALESFNKVSEYWGKIPDPGDKGHIWRILVILFQKILLMNELKDHKKANEYFQELQDVTKDSKSPGVILRRNFLEGLILKSSDRIGEKFKAQAIFQDIVEEKIYDMQIYSLSILNLCELLILELKISPTPEERLKELSTLVGKMSELGRTQDILNLLVMGEVIHGKIQLVKNELESARLSFEQAEKIAEQHNLTYLLSQVKVEQNYVDSEISKWHEIPMMNLSISERVEKARIHEYLTHAISVKERMIDTGSTNTN